MKAILFLLAFFILASFALLYSVDTDQELMPAPSFQSVVVLDERTDCDKKAEMVLYDKWTEFSHGTLKPLTKTEADIAYLYRDLSLELCQR